MEVVAAVKDSPSGRSAAVFTNDLDGDAPCRGGRHRSSGHQLTDIWLGPASLLRGFKASGSMSKEQGTEGLCLTPRSKRWP